MTEPNTAPAANEAPKKAPITETSYFKADGKEADTPLDNVTKVVFRLVAAQRDWSFDYTSQREAMASAGISANEINLRVAFDSFGTKTKLNNIANSVRNNKKIAGTEAAGPGPQAAAIDDFLAEAEKGNWRGEAGELVTGTADLAEAIKRYQISKGKAAESISVESLKAQLDSLSAEDRKGRRDNPQIQVFLQEIRLERARLKAAAAAGAPATGEADPLLDMA